MGKIGRANCLAALGYQRAEYLVQPTNEHCLEEGFWPEADLGQHKPKAAIDSRPAASQSKNMLSECAVPA